MANFVFRHLLVVALALLGGNAGAGGAADEDFLLQHIGGAVADVGAGLDDLVSSKLILRLVLPTWVISP